MCINTKKRRIKTKFYEIVPLEDGTADVYLIPNGTIYETEDGFREYDVTLLVMRGVDPYEGMEENIREHYYDWCASAQPVGIG